MTCFVTTGLKLGPFLKLIFEILASSRNPTRQIVQKYMTGTLMFCCFGGKNQNKLLTCWILTSYHIPIHSGFDAKRIVFNFGLDMLGFTMWAFAK